MPVSQGHDRGAVMDWLSRDEPDYVPAVDFGTVRYLGTGEHGGPLVSFRSTEKVDEPFETREIECALDANCDWWTDDGIVGKPELVKAGGFLSSWDDGFRVRETKAYRAELAQLTEEEEYGEDT